MAYLNKLITLHQEIEVDIEVEEFLNECDESEIIEIVEWLSLKGHI